MTVQVLHGDCLSLLPTLPDNSIDAIVTDPPYCLDSIRRRFGSPTAKPTSARQHRGIARGFMGCSWDDDIAFRTDVWRECLRVLKPGGHIAVFGGSRTHHRVWVAVEDAGFEIRDTLMWVYGSGFPKSRNVSKAIDVELGAARYKTGQGKAADGTYISTPGRDGAAAGGYNGGYGDIDHAAPATPQAEQWQGWGTALKPSHEPILLARKPLECNTVAENVLVHGTGGINVDATRVKTTTQADEEHRQSAWSHHEHSRSFHGQKYRDLSGVQAPAGRWPPNLLLSNDEEVLECFPQSKSCSSPSAARPEGSILGGRRSQGSIYPGEDGSAARFFPALGYSEDERRVFYQSKANKRDRAGSKHPTIKPIKLMEWLCKLITPPGGTILDPFAGSGSTGQAASNLGFDCILIEQSEEYVADIQRRMNQSDDLVTFTRSTTNFSLSSP